ncbi:MAG TPA: universal stress protein [Candidatus Dormibacteraeota bacterium]|nr:universal stress protein [Candidatus Dormibacteraeota bacterium]
MTKIVLAVEDRDFAAAAVEAVRRQFRPERSEIYLYHATDPLIYMPLYDGAAMDAGRIEISRAEDLKEAQSLVEQTAKPLRGAGYRVTTAIEEGEPRTAIVDYAERVKADLIVVGSHGRRGLSRLLLGSVSEFVARHAACSVEIVRPLARAA